MINEKLNYQVLLKEVRDQLGLSQEELARALGVSFNSINRWENGKVTPSRLAVNHLENFVKRLVEEGKLKIPKAMLEVLFKEAI